jgi:hypothetical protein
MVYFNQRAATPKTRAEKDQWGQVLDFQQRFPKEGLWWPYRSKVQFEKLVRNHLSQFLRQRGDTTPAAPPIRPGHDTPVPVQQHGSVGIAIRSRSVATGAGGVAIGGHVYGGDVQLGPAAVPEPTNGVQNAYLTWLMD